MWGHYALLFLFVFVALFAVNTNYHHLNEVLNAFSHDYLYHATLIDRLNVDVYFDKPLIRILVADHFTNNLRHDNYDYTVIFYKDGEVCPENEQCKYFTINLVAPLGFNLYFDKTFSYYLT